MCQDDVEVGAIAGSAAALAVKSQLLPLVTENTFEDKIDQLIQSKKDLADPSVVTGKTFIGKMSNRELEDLVKL